MEMSVQTKTDISPTGGGLIIRTWNLNITDMNAQLYMVVRRRTGTWLT
jgi:hypothetical protein